MSVSLILDSEFAPIILLLQQHFSLSGFCNLYEKSYCHKMKNMVQLFEMDKS